MLGNIVFIWGGQKFSKNLRLLINKEEEEDGYWGDNSSLWEMREDPCRVQFLLGGAGMYMAQRKGIRHEFK